MTVVWTELAFAQLNAINGYLENPRAAERVIRRIRHRVRQLSRFPLSGRVIPEFRDSTRREVIVGQFRVFHRIEEEQIVILSVVDGHTLLDPSSVSEAVAEYGYEFERAL